MPVDFTNKKVEKTNYDYLREILKGNEEGIEFLEGFDKEMKTLLEEKDDRIKELELELDNATDEDEVSYDNETDLGFGMKESLRWSAPNIAISSMMEELEDAINRGVTALKIENILRAL